MAKKSITFDKKYISAAEFDYLSDSERSDIIAALDNSNAIIMRYDDGRDHFYAVIDLTKKPEVHVWEVTGKFAWKTGILYDIMASFARAFGYQKITFCAANDATAKLGKRLGFKRVFHNQYEVAV